ncbi:hypothetical protein MMC28_007478 [Mycoblastus sanguinarius]|nr:hypothetical protein [Mycoblastus sanguinarius]
MALVDYSGSEDSDQEEKASAQELLKGKATPNKPAFQKVVDRSNPHKIRVNLPEPSKTALNDTEDDFEPPAKRVKVGSGGLNGFNSFLPAPKRPAATIGGIATGGAKRGGLGSGISLKTGATPGFSRDTARIDSNLDEDEDAGHEMAADESRHEQARDYKPPNMEDKNPMSETIQEPKKKGNSMMFKPLSVARKPQKKKAPPTSGTGEAVLQGNGATQQTKAAPNVSLFSTGDIQEKRTISSSTNGAYQPMMYQPDDPEPVSSPLASAADTHSNGYNFADKTTLANNSELAEQAPQSLSTIATDLNLSASARRQLLGRQKHDASTINLVNFNTDQEYAANELLRQAGEQLQHNPVRAIAPGKHSLKQLVNAASTQRDALEEQFASGRRNKKEAGSKYGW